MPVTLGPPKQCAILAALVLAGPAEMSRTDLVEAVWGPDHPQSALSTLRTHIYQLRRAFGRDGAAVIRSTNHHHSLQLVGASTDLEQFTDHVSRAREARRDHDVSRATYHLEEALALWRGSAFPGLAGARADAERERLHEMRMWALVERLDYDLALGHHDRAIAELAAHVKANPLHEKLREMLMIALYRTGRQADALGVFHDLRHRLRDELGIDPSPGLRTVHQQILTAELDDRHGVPRLGYGSKSGW